MQQMINMKEADLQTLTELLGANKANLVYEYFHQGLGRLEEKT